jgi:hypothetical protein
LDSRNTRKCAETGAHEYSLLVFLRILRATLKIKCLRFKT